MHESAIVDIQTLSDNSRALSLDSNDVLQIWTLVQNDETEGGGNATPAGFTCRGICGAIRLCPNDRDLITYLSANPKE